MSKHKYNPEYTKYVFAAIEHMGECLPQGVVCMETLSNAAMKPGILNKPKLKTRTEIKVILRSLERLQKNNI